MHEVDLNRVEFYTKNDLMTGHYLQIGEEKLRGADSKSSSSDINDVLELYNLKKYIDNGMYLKSWTQDDITNFKQKAVEYKKAIGQFMATIDDANVISLYGKTLRGYIHSFWELVNNQNVYKRISRAVFDQILSGEPDLIYEILTHKGLVDQFGTEIRNFLLTYPQAAEILLSVYEVQHNYLKNEMWVPKNLTIEDKECIVSKYLDSSDVNYNYVELIQNIKNKKDFKISDKIRLKAKQLHRSHTEKFFAEKGGQKYGVSISFPENATLVKDCIFDEDSFHFHYLYSIDFIKQNNNPYMLFKNFTTLFDYLDGYNRINLVNRRSQMSVLERIVGVHSQNEYRGGFAFNLSEMTSYAQIYKYEKIVTDLNESLENILHFVFTSAFQEKYDFASNARFSIPSATNSYFEKVRLLAPEFESVLKQFKLFVEEGSIDFELLEISSAPTAIKDIPSLNSKKYIYFNEGNEEMVGCTNLFFSDPHLAFVEPFKELKYRTFFDLLANEQVRFDNYEEYQKPQIQYLISNRLICIDENGFVQILNPERLLIFKDLHDNEVASFHHYPVGIQNEVQKMANENIVYFESTLFSKPEQAYFNYYLNKSEFTNGLDLRNRYLHGTQPDQNETKQHEYAYFTYLKIMVLALLKIEDDLIISKTRNG